MTMHEMVYRGVFLKMPVPNIVLNRSCLSLLLPGCLASDFSPEGSSGCCPMGLGDTYPKGR